MGSRSCISNKYTWLRPRPGGYVTDSRYSGADMTVLVLRWGINPISFSRNVLDLWAAMHHLPSYEAALHLADTFQVPRNREEEPVEPGKTGPLVANPDGHRKPT